MIVIVISLSQRLMGYGTYNVIGYVWVMVHRQYGYGYLQCNRYVEVLYFLVKPTEIQFLLIVGVFILSAK